MFQFDGNVLQKREDPAGWMFIAENVEDETLFGRKRVAIVGEIRVKDRFLGTL
jgi:hypothetical protein